MAQFLGTVVKMPVAFPGLWEEGYIRTYVNREASAEMRPGTVLGQGTGDNGALLLAATADKMIGVLTHRDGYIDQIELGVNGLKPKVVMGLLDKGTAYLIVEEDVTPASDVHIRCVAVGVEVPGALRGSADASGCFLAKPFMRFLDASVLAADGVTKVVRVAFDFTGRGA